MRPALPGAGEGSAALAGPGTLAYGLGTASVTAGCLLVTGQRGRLTPLLQGLLTRMSEVGAGVERRLPRHLLL